MSAYLETFYPELEISEIIVEEEPEIAEKYRVMAVPTILYREKRLVGKSSIVNVVRFIGKTGIKPIDYLMIEPYPFSSVVLVLGVAGTGRTLLCQQFACEALRKKLGVVYVNCDDFADSVRESISKMGSDVKDCESSGKFVFIDCYSPQAGLESHENYSADSRNLPNLSTEILRALGELNANVLILDSLNSVLLGSEFELTLDFLRTLFARIRHSKAACLIKLNSKAFPLNTVEAVKDMVDGVMQTRVEETFEGIRYYLRILKMKGARHKTSWVPYEIDPERGLLKSS